jgi:hypothetical protein
VARRWPAAADHPAARAASGASNLAPSTGHTGGGSYTKGIEWFKVGNITAA